MVKSIALTLAEHQAYLSSKREPAVPLEPHAYPSRSTKLNHKAVGTYINTLISMGKRDWSEAEAVRLSSHFDSMLSCVEIYTGNPSHPRYEDIFPGIIRDKAFSLEIGGLMGAAKYYQQVYDVSRHFNHLLAFIIGSDPEATKKSLQANCQRLNQDFDNLCIGLCSVEPALMNGIDLACFNGISTQLDQLIMLCVQFPKKCIFNWGSGYLDLTSSKYTPAQRFTMFLTFQLAALTQHIFDYIIKDYDKEQGRSCMLVSKTTSSLVFQSNRADPRPTFEVTLGDQMFTLEPSLFHSGNYINRFVKGCL